MQGGVESAAFIDLKDDFYWSTEIKGVMFGDSSLGGKDQFGKPQPPTFAFTSDPTANFSGRQTPYKTIYTVFDTGTSFTLIPANYWKAWTEQLIHHFKIEQNLIKDGAFAFFCDER